jgi:hypothetical protein
MPSNNKTPNKRANEDIVDNMPKISAEVSLVIVNQKA